MSGLVKIESTDYLYSYILQAATYIKILKLNRYIKTNWTGTVTVFVIYEKIHITRLLSETKDNYEDSLIQLSFSIHAYRCSAKLTRKGRRQSCFGV